MRKPSINRSSILEIALEGKMKLNGGGNGNFAWDSLDYSMLLSC